MALYDKASLVLIPSGTKEGVCFSQKPTNGDGDFTFTRASSATRVNSDGLIEKETQNQITYSNTFSETAWSKYLISLTSGQSGYDGTSDAWLLERSGAFGNVYRNVSNSGVFTWSVYAKAGSYDFLCLRFRNTSNAYRSAFFDLSNGTLGSVDSNMIKHSIEDVGSGWYRCQIAFNDSAVNQVMIYPSDVNNGIGNSGTGNIYIQDAQLNQGLVADSYLETTTTAVYGGITDNIPRLDYNGSCPSLLLEPQRTNVILNSEYIEGWIGANTTPIANSGISPEGVNNATSITFTSGGYWYQGITLSYSVGQTFTWSIYANTETRVIEWGGATPAGTTTYEVIDSGNGWYRQILTRTMSGSGTGQFQTLMNLGYIGAGVEFKVYGAQLEEGSYATSYIPTYGASVTKLKDDCSVTGITDLIGQTEGTLFAEVDWNVKPESGSPVIGILTLNNGANNLQNSILLGIERKSGGTNRVYCFVINSNVTQAEIYGSAITDGTYKIAFAYKANDFALYVNGSQIGTDTSGSVPALSEVLLGKRFGTDTYIQSEGTKQALLFKTRLSNEELADLTTI